MTALNRLPIVVIAICEAVMIYTATGVAKVAFTQLDAVYAAVPRRFHGPDATGMA